jgi:PadR family transcriptional regulator, regulatory protein PadR
VLLALVLMADPYGRHWGYELGKKAGLRSGVVYPALSRMLEDGWLSDGWEESWEGDRKRPPRRYYEITDKGRHELAALVATAQTDRRFAGAVMFRASEA